MLPKNAFKIFVILIINISFGDTADTRKNQTTFSTEYFAIESISAFAVGGIFTILLLNNTSGKTFDELGKNSIIVYSSGNLIGAASVSIILRKKMTIKPILYSAIGSIAGASVGSFIANKNVKNGEYATFFLVPFFSGLGAELAF